MPTGGLRQGDPLSPYLFLLCAEGLIGLIKKAVQMGVIQGVAATRSGPRITNLFFADDCLLFCKTRREDCRELVRILEVYKKAAGHEVNLSKLRIMFSKNTNSADKQCAKDILSIKKSMEHDKYLGLPLMFGRSKARELRYIKERIGHRIQSWGGRFLSQTGRAILIQSIGQAIPLYAMKYFKFSRGFLHDLNMMMAGFW